MKIKALKPFTMRDSDTGALTSIACGSIAVMDDEVESPYKPTADITLYAVYVAE